MSEPSTESSSAPRAQGEIPEERHPPIVARIPYLNSAPFYLCWEEVESEEAGHWHSIDLVPRHLGIAAAEGRVDAGLMALCDLIRLRDEFEPLEVPAVPEPRCFGIANTDRVDSVLLLIRDDAPVNVTAGATSGEATELDLTAEEAHYLAGSRIGITGESSTSYRLLRLLLEARFDARPAAYTRLAFDASPERALSAVLAIGDQALRWKRTPPEGFRVAMDLATSWNRWTGMPFVFAKWGVRRSLAPERKEGLGHVLASSLAESGNRMHDLVCNQPEDLGSPDELKAYLENFTYDLGPAELQAAARFRELLDERNIPCTAD